MNEMLQNETRIAQRRDCGRDGGWRVYCGPVEAGMCSCGERIPHRLLWRVPHEEATSPDAHKEAILDAERVPTIDCPNCASKGTQVEKELLMNDIHYAAQSTDPAVLDRLADSEDWLVKLEVARNPKTTPETLERLAAADCYEVVAAVAENPSIPLWLLDDLATHHHWEVRAGVALNSQWTRDKLTTALYQGVYNRVASHLLTQMERSMEETVQRGVHCMYRSGALRCAVGCLIDDQHYSPSLEGQAPQDLEVDEAVQASLGVVFLDPVDHGGFLSLLRDLQSVHDNHMADVWSIELVKVAAKNQLSAVAVQVC